MDVCTFAMLALPVLIPMVLLAPFWIPIFILFTLLSVAKEMTVAGFNKVKIFLKTGKFSYTKESFAKVHMKNFLKME